jgi:McbB family protein
MEKEKDMSDLHLNEFQSCFLDESQYLVISKSGSHNVNDPQVINLIEGLKSQGISELNSFKHPEKKEIFNYLMSELQVISKKRPSGWGINKLLIITDQPTFSEMISELALQAGFENIVFVNSPEEIKEEQALIVSFLENYNEVVMNGILDKVNHGHDLFSLSSYHLGDLGLIDNLYYGGSGRPCHFCNLGELKGEHAQKLTHQEQSFFQIHNYILKNNLPISSGAKLTKADIGSFAKKVFTKIQPLLRTSHDLNLNVEELQFFQRYDF